MNELDKNEKFIEILKQAEESWAGEIGLSRKNDLEKFVKERFGQYSERFGIPLVDVFESIENSRTYSAINFYQDANFPSVDEVEIFENRQEFFDIYEKDKFICPNCDSISSHPTICDSGAMMDKFKKKSEACNWKAFGLFGTMGHGMKLMFKDDFISGECRTVYEIFQPVKKKESEDK